MRKYLPLLVFLFSIPVLGQQRAVITGHVQTPNGASAAGVSILAAQSANRLMNAIGTTDESGNFRIENLNPGRYVILAGATVASVNEAGETMQVVVVSRPMPFYLFSNVGRATTQGTFYPGTDNLEEASEITVSAGETLENVNITLAQGPNPPMEVPMRILTGRFIAESGDTPTIGSNELTFMISDSPANLYSEVTFRGGFQPGANLTRLQTAGGPKALSSVLGMPSSPDGKFRLLLPDGVYRVSQEVPMKTNGRDAKYYVKGISFGKTDLTKDLMTIGGPPQEELVVTLAKCADTKEPFCR